MSDAVNASNIEAIIKNLRHDKVVVIVGAGVAAATTEVQSAKSWLSLIFSGVDFIEQHVPDVPKEFRGIIEFQLRNADKMPMLIAAAEMVSGTLGAPSGHHFRDWLQDAIGDATVDDDRLIHAIASLDRPIATTNYDTFFEICLSRNARTWRDSVASQSALVGSTRDIVHLHGVWTDPGSVVFGGQSYGMVLGNEPAQGLEQSIFSLRSVLLIGCGATTQDPNFGRLIELLNRLYRETSLRHYRLCTNAELETLRHEHAGGSIDPVSYGESHADLIPFLEKLASSASSEGSTGIALTVGRELVQRLRSESVFADRLPNLESRTIDELVVPPVVLPVSHEQFVAAQRDPDAPKLQRIDVASDLAHHKTTVLVGDESSGLSTALAYMVSQANNIDDLSAPVVVDFRTFASSRPLDRALRLTLRTAAVSISNSDALPQLVVAIDNVSPSDRGAYIRLMAELAEEKWDWLIIGCRPGSEADINEDLRRAGYIPTTRYLGRLNTKDIKDVAILVAPSQASAITQRAVAIIQKEHLARTPLTVCLLISVLIAGEALLSTSSETALLDAYLALLLGRGSAYDDARYVLDSHDNSALLSELASTFVHRNSAELTEVDVIACFSDYFERVGWSESATEALNALVRRHVVVRRAGRISFAQSSFLHLFAARKAIEDPEFLAFLLRDPVSFTSIIRHYAALKRNDAHLVGSMRDLAVATIDANSTVVQRGHNLSAVKTRMVDDADEERLLRSLDPIDFEKSQQQLEASPSLTAEDGDADPLDDVPDTDIAPFTPLRIQDEDVPPLVRTLRVLTLVSGVIRDSESVSDLELKRDALVATLRLWGQLVDAFEADESFNEFNRLAMTAVVDELVGEQSDESKQDVVDYLVRLSPVLTAMTGMTLTLASRKLVVTLNTALSTEAAREDAGLAAMGALLSFDMHPAGWPRAFEQMERYHPAVSVNEVVLNMLARFAYYELDLNEPDALTLREFLADQAARRRGTPGTAAFKTARSRAMQRLERNRLQKAITTASSPGDRA